MTGNAESGRRAFARMAWADAYRELSSSPAALDADDLERLAVASYLVGRDDESRAAWERAQVEHERRGDLASVAGVVDGAPQLRFAVFGRDEVVIEDTWTVSGLRGTGSHHFHVDAVDVPSERTCGFEDPPCIDAPATRVPEPSLFAMAVASAAMGTALGALDDIRVLAIEKTPLLAGTSLAQSATFQRDLATADTELRAARSLLADTAGWMWRNAEEGTPLTLEQRARVRAAAAWATARAVDVVDFAYRSGGGGAVYADSPLQRRLRDVHAITQHFLVRPDTMTTAGTVFAGQELALPVF